MKKTTKNTKNTTNFNTLADTIFKNIKNVKKSWCDNNPNWYSIHNAVDNYDGKIDLDLLLYWSVCGQVDTAVRPLLKMVIKMLAVSNGYNSPKTFGETQMLFMTGINKNQIRTLCKAVCMGTCACPGDEKEFVKVLTNFYCDMSIVERIEFLNEFLDEHKTLVSK